MRELYHAPRTWELKCKDCTRGLLAGQACPTCNGSGCLPRSYDDLLRIVKRQEGRLAKKYGQAADRRLKAEVARLSLVNKHVTARLQTQQQAIKAFWEMRALLVEILEKDERAVAELKKLDIIPDTRLVAKARALLAKYPV